jgi:hypothetical protein
MMGQPAHAMWNSERGESRRVNAGEFELGKGPIDSSGDLSELPGIVILADDDFYIELDPYFPVFEAPGYLQRRCNVSTATPRGYECVGGLALNAQGKWCAEVDTAFNPRSGCEWRDLGHFVDRFEALAALWVSRHEALCGRRVD